MKIEFCCEDLKIDYDEGGFSLDSMRVRVIEEDGAVVTWICVVTCPYCGKSIEIVEAAE